ncbi:MAG: phosphoribosylglycinamide formyltransferase, partial [Actinobacteria bacterium]|nr:phosphoribosylglycinamide formyltransferase [Actinomycetota bacterium]
MAKPFPIAVLASGTGTNLQAIIDQLHGRDGIEVVGVVSDKPTARALKRAREAGIETAVFPESEHELREARDEAMAEWLERSGA